MARLNIAPGAGVSYNATKVSFLFNKDDLIITRMQKNHLSPMCVKCLHIFFFLPTFQAFIKMHVSPLYCCIITLDEEAVLFTRILFLAK